MTIYDKELNKNKKTRKLVGNESQTVTHTG